MAKRDRCAEQLDIIAALRSEPDLALATGALRKHLSHASGIVVAKAVQVVRERKLDALGPELAAAFDRLLPGGGKADPTNAAKFGIVTAGVELDCLSVETYLAAIRHVQMEGSFGPPVDMARAMRGQAAFGLLNVKHRDALYEIADLLDQDGDARRGGIRALGTVVGESSALMLRLTARRYAGDADTLAETFTSLNAIEAARSFDFIAAFVDDADPNVADVAALALAESRQPHACDALLAAWRRHASFAEDPRAFFTALSMTRKPAAIELLVDRAANAKPSDAAAAVDALRLHRGDDALRGRLSTIVAARGERAIDEAFRTFA